MHVDRTRFLLLTAALASTTVGCRRIKSEILANVNADDEDAGGGASGAPMLPLSSFATADASVVVGTGVALDAGTQLRAYTPPRPRGDGGVSDCADLQPSGPTCESFSIVKSWCQDSKKVLTPSAQTQVLACIAAHSGKPTICSAFLNRTCDVQAFHAAAADPASAAECEEIVTKCATRPEIQFRGGVLDARVSQTTCQQVFAAAKPAMHSRVARCMKEDCKIGWCAVESTR